MKKISILSAVLLTVILASSSFAQSTKYSVLTRDAWVFGFGFTYPRLISTPLEAADENYGGFLSIQKNFSEHAGVRVKGSYNHVEGDYGFPGNIQTMSNNIIAGDIDLLYYLTPCEPISPYLAVGFGLINFQPENTPDPSLDEENFTDFQWNLGFGAEWRLSANWRLKTELTYHTAANSKIDGVYDAGNGLIGGSNDTYMNFDLGFAYYFGQGEKSLMCDLYEGINARVDYEMIENIVKKYATEPTEVDYNRIEDIVKKHCKAQQLEEKWVLVGVNFDFNKATLRPEAYPILYNAAEILLEHPDVDVVIEGHTDYIGSESYNQKLSLKRAETVKNFLIAKGVDASRITTVGKGESEPIFKDKSEQSRFYNRRIEFHVKNK